MKIAFLQYDVHHDKERNFQLIQQHLDMLTCDLLVLPELSLCGYLFKNQDELAAAAESIPAGPSVARMAELSRLYDCAILFGMAEKEKDHLYNTAVLVSQGEYCGRYRKMHLSDFEKTLFEPGTENPVFEVMGIRIGVQICFDLWFPEVSREQILQGAQLLCVLANFGGETTSRIAPVRAIENLTPLVLCNRIGHEFLPELDASFLGKSAVYGADGQCLTGEVPQQELLGVREISLPFKRSNVICRDFLAEMSVHYQDVVNKVPLPVNNA